MLKDGEEKEFHEKVLHNVDSWYPSGFRQSMNFQFSVEKQAAGLKRFYPR